MRRWLSRGRTEKAFNNAKNVRAGHVLGSVVDLLRAIFDVGSDQHATPRFAGSPSSSYVSSHGVMRDFRQTVLHVLKAKLGDVYDVLRECPDPPAAGPLRCALDSLHDSGTSTKVLCTAFVVVVQARSRLTLSQQH